MAILSMDAVLALFADLEFLPRNGRVVTSPLLPQRDSESRTSPSARQRQAFLFLQALERFSA